MQLMDAAVVAEVVTDAVEVVAMAVVMVVTKQTLPAPLVSFPK